MGSEEDGEEDQQSHTEFSEDGSVVFREDTAALEEDSGSEQSDSSTTERARALQAEMKEFRNDWVETEPKAAEMLARVLFRK